MENSPVKPSGLVGTRHRQICLIFFGLMICYFQRSNLAVGLVAMSNPSPNSNIQAIDYSINERGWLSGLFYLGYLMSGIPAGLLADKYGPVRLVSVVGGILCGLATIAVPFAAISWGFEAVCATRVIQGLGQGVFYPSTQAFLSKWAIPLEREAFSWVWSGGQLGTIIMMPLGGLIAEGPGGWPTIFYFSGALAIAWGIICLIFGADSPEQHRSISEEERNYILTNFPESSLKGKNMRIPIKKIATSLPVWAILICQSCENWGFAILLTLTPSYLTGVYGFDVAQNGFLSALPYLAMFICSYLFSFFGGKLRDRTSVNFNRKYWTSVAMFGTAASLVSLAYFDASAKGALSLLVLASALDAGIYTGYLSNHLDLAPNYAGILLGVTNALGNISSIAAPIWVGTIVKDQHSMEEWQMVFLVTAALKVAGNLFFLIFGTTAVQPWNFYQLEDVTKGDGDENRKRRAPYTIDCS